MILNVSGRTDIVAFYTKWFMNRINEGFFDVRNPINPKLISRIYYSDIDLIVFCTKNPAPIIPYIKEINKPIIFHITLTPYHNDIEPNVKNKNEIINDIIELSKILGKENIFLRYDPILLNDRYDINYHKNAFKKLCDLLDGYVENIIISFVDDYKNLRKHKNEIKYYDITDNDIKEIVISFSNIAKEHNISIRGCAEKNLKEYGFINESCFSQKLAYEKTSKVYKIGKWRGNDLCKCVEMADIGAYNTCKHLCKYCYANFNEDEINKNILNHNPNSSLLIGEILKDDIIKIRRK